MEFIVRTKSASNEVAMWSVSGLDYAYEVFEGAGEAMVAIGGNAMLIDAETGEIIADTEDWASNDFTVDDYELVFGSTDALRVALDNFTLTLKMVCTAW